MLKYMKLIAAAWSTWKVTSKRFGRAGGLFATALVIVALIAVNRVLRDRNPELADAVEEAV